MKSVQFLLFGVMLFVPAMSISQTLSYPADTLHSQRGLESRATEQLIVRRDSIIRFTYKDGPDSTMWMYSSQDAGRSWDSVKLTYEFNPNQPLPSNELASMSISLDRQYVIITRDGRTLLRDSVYSRGLDTSLRAGPIFYHPLNSQQQYLWCTPKRHGRYDVNCWQYRQGDTGTWKRMALPVAWAGLTRRYRLSFDYGEPNRIWMTLIQETPAEPIPDQCYYSDNNGEAWVRVPSPLPSYIGLLAPGVGIEWAREVVRDRPAESFANPVLVNAINRTTDTLPWTERILEQVFSTIEPQTIRETNIGGYGYPNFSGPVTLSFHSNPVRPELITTVFNVRYALDEFRDTTLQTICLTKDGGLKWSILEEDWNRVIFPPSSADTIHAHNPFVEIDPATGSIYRATWEYDRRKEPGSRALAAVVIKHDLSNVVSVSTKPKLTDKTKLTAFPNPISNQDLTIEIGEVTGTGRLVISNSIGEIEYSTILSEGKKQQLVLRLEGKSKGIRYIALVDMAGMWATTFIKL